MIGEGRMTRGRQIATLFIVIVLSSRMFAIFKRLTFFFSLELWKHTNEMHLFANYFDDYVRLSEDYHLTKIIFCVIFVHILQNKDVAHFSERIFFMRKLHRLSSQK